TVIGEKVVGSLAESSADLAACKALGDKVNSRTASMGVALTSCTVPAAGRPTFDIEAHELEMGVGIHGEPGRRRESMRPADEIVADLVGAILEDLKPQRGSEVLLMVNGFTGTPLMELYVLYNAAAKLLEKDGLTVSRSLVGDYVTSLEMAGASITVCLLDEEIRRYWDAPVHTPALRWGR
ncbi:MAG TPA: dihydroxyacetone kinase subunit DhaK, partial [Methylococcaceae bacterium]|nr:dihydroxyacetone kinase subunit DhaK [Methylococcaceae bacterium]